MSTPDHPRESDEERRARTAREREQPPPFLPPQSARQPPPFLPPQSPQPANPQPGPPGQAQSRPPFMPPHPQPGQPQPPYHQPSFTPPQAPPQQQAHSRPPFAPPQSHPHPPTQSQPQPAPAPSQASPPSRSLPPQFANASQGGFVANPGLPLFDPPPQATPYPYAPPYGGPSGPGGPGGPTGPIPGPVPGPVPAQPTPHEHGFIFGPPLDPGRAGPARVRPVLLRSTILALAVLAVAGVGAVRQAVKDTTDYDNTGRRMAVAWALKDGRDGPPIEQTPVAGSRVLEGTWFHGDTVVRSELSRVVAYRVDTGATVWQTPLPGGAAMCAAGAETDGPIAVVVYGVGPACDRIAGIDITSGKEVWSKPRPAKDAAVSGNERLAVAQGVAVTADTAFRIRDGAQLWAADRNFAAGCRVFAFRGGAALVANGRCGTTDTVWAVDPATGKPKWAHSVPKGGTVIGSPVVATSPVIVDEPTTAGASRLIVLTDKGEPAYPIETGSPVISNALGPAPRILADKRTIYVPGNNGESLHTSDKSWANQIVAIDRATGNVRWVSALPAAVKALGVSVDSKAAPIRIDEDGGLRVWVNAGAGKPPRLVRFEPNDGHIRVLDEYPLRLGFALAVDMPKPFEQDGRLFLVKEDTGDLALSYRLIVGG